MRRKKRIKKRKVSKSVLILSLVVVIAIIISVAIYLNQQQGSFQKRTAEEYFEILNATVDYGDFRQNDTVVIYTISFEIKAVGGDAHDVMVQSWARAQNYAVGTILEGETKAVMEMTSNPPFGILSRENEDGKFPMEIRITSMEADGYVTIYF